MVSESVQVHSAITFHTEVQILSSFVCANLQLQQRRIHSHSFVTHYNDVGGPYNLFTAFSCVIKPLFGIGPV